MLENLNVKVSEPTGFRELVKAEGIARGEVLEAGSDMGVIQDIKNIINPLSEFENGLRGPEAQQFAQCL